MPMEEEYVAGRNTSNAIADADKLLALFGRMALVRETEIRLRELFNDGKFPGFIHLRIGQEATSVGGCAALNDGDTLSSTPRGPGHCIATGDAPLGMVQEILGPTEGERQRSG